MSNPFFGSKDSGCLNATAILLIKKKKNGVLHLIKRRTLKKFFKGKS